MRLIDADDFLQSEIKRCHCVPLVGSCDRDYESLKVLLMQTPAVDVAPVARCKECEHAERYERIDGTAGYYCGHPQNTFTYGERWDRIFKPAKEADDFCSYGARKENENG